MTTQRQQQWYASSLLAQAPTNWTESLEPEYEKQRKAGELQGQRLKQRDDRWLEIEKEQSLVDRLDELSEFSQKIGSAVKQRKVAAEQAKAADKLNFEVLYNKNVSGKDQKEIDKIFRDKEIWQKDVKNLKIDHINYTQRINNSNLSDEAKSFLLSNHGGHALKVQHLLGSQVLDNAHARWQKKLSDSTYQRKFDDLGGDTAAEKQQFEKFLFSEYQSLNFNEDYIANNFQKETNRWLDTKGNLSKLKYKQIQSTDLELFHDANLEAAGKSDNPNALLEEVQGQIMSLVKESEEVTFNPDGTETSTFGVTYEDAKNTVGNRLYRLGKAGLLESHEVEAIRKSLLLIPTAAGDQGELLFSTEQWGRIQQGINEYGINAVNQNNTRLTTNAVNAHATIINPNSDLTSQEKEELKNSTILSLERAGLTDTDTYKHLNKLDHTVQDADSYKDVRTENIAYYSGGKQSHRLKDKKLFESIGQGQVSDELVKLAEADEKYFKDVDLPHTHEDLVKEEKHNLATSPGQTDKIPTLNTTTTEEFKNLAKLMALKRQEFHIIARSDFPDDNIKAKNQAEGHFKAWKIDNGINEIDDGKNPDAGILSPTNEGIYRIERERQAALTEKSGLGSRSNTRFWSGNLTSGYEQFGGDKNALLDSPNSLTTHGDIDAAFINQPNDAQGNIKPYYSPETIFKSRALRIQPSQYLLRQIRALKNSKDWKDTNFYQRRNLGQYEKILENAPDIQIEQALENFADNDLLFLWRNGVENMSGNQLTRLIDTLTEFKWHPSLSSVKTDETFGHEIRTFK